MVVRLMCTKSKFLLLANYRQVISPEKHYRARHTVASSHGEILARPVKIPFGLLKVFFATVPGILFGATLAKNGAAWLEENEIFIPADDDDDD